MPVRRIGRGGGARGGQHTGCACPAPGRPEPPGRAGSRAAAGRSRHRHPVHGEGHLPGVPGRRRRGRAVGAVPRPRHAGHPAAAGPGGRWRRRGGRAALLVGRAGPGGVRGPDRDRDPGLAPDRRHGRLPAGRDRRGLRRRLPAADGGVRRAHARHARRVTAHPGLHHPGRVQRRRRLLHRHPPRAPPDGARDQPEEDLGGVRGLGAGLRGGRGHHCCRCCCTGRSGRDCWWARPRCWRPRSGTWPNRRSSGTWRSRTWARSCPGTAASSTGSTRWPLAAPVVWLLLLVFIPAAAHH